MDTQKNVYNIIWIDDEIDTLLDERKERILEKNGFNLIGTARTFTEFVCLMDLSYDRVDAVITDANFSTSSLDPKNERDLSGLVKVRESIAKYNEKRVIPFYLFTMRGKVLVEKCEDGELDYFYGNNRYFTKGQFGEMLEQIRKDVDHIGSSSFRIRNKYAEELEAAAMVEGNEDILIHGLLYEDSGDWEAAKNYFNSLRQVIEAIFEKCKKLKIIPEIDGLGAISNFLGRNNNDMYTISEQQEIMPKPLARALWYFLDIVQDGSHKKDDSNLGVGKYVTETRNLNLFRSVLNIAMDLCVWYAKCEEEAYQPDFTPKWSRKEIIDGAEIQNSNKTEDEYEYEGVVKREKGKFYCGRYLLQTPRDGRYQEGDTIRVIKSIENDREHFFNDEGTEVDRFAFKVTKIR